MSFLSEKHLEDLRSSGLNDKLIKDIGFYTCDASEANKLLDRSDIDCQCLVIPYPGADGFIRLKPDGIIIGSDNKPARYLQRGGSESRLFIHQAIKEYYFSQNGIGQIPFLIVEGEKKALKATQDLFFAECLFQPIGLSGVFNFKTRKTLHTNKGDKAISDYINDIKNLPVENRLVYICFDSNIEFNEQVQEAENELGKFFIGAGAKRVLTIRIPHDESYGKHGLGIDDYLIKYGTNNFKELARNARSNSAVRYSVKFTRKLPDKSFFDKVDIIVSLILNDLKQSGSFYHDNNGIYFFNNINKIMLNVEEESFLMRLADDYGLYRDNSEFKSVISKVEEYGALQGKKIAIKHTAFFDTATKSLYVYDNDGRMFEIGNECSNIQTKDNGYNSIFFKHKSEQSPITYHHNKKGFFEQYILDVCNFQETDFTKLSQNQQKFLFEVWFYSLFFPNLMPTKPILVMTGDYGSGKSTIQRLVGKLLFGSGFNVSTIQSERDFLTSIINKYYLVYDNADIAETWVQNAICSLATGFKVEVRKMYSNMEMFQADPIAYLAMNSMTQQLYKRPDVASRLLIFRTKKIQQNISDHLLTAQILDHRDEILSEVFDNLHAMLKYIDGSFSYFGSFRMADFANLGTKIATYFGREKEFEHILNIMSMEQSELPLEDNPIIDIIDKWLNNRITDFPITTGELYAQLSYIAEQNKMFFPFKSSISLGKQLQTSLENLKSHYQISFAKGGGNRLKWDIRYKDTIRR